MKAGSCARYTLLVMAPWSPCIWDSTWHHTLYPIPLVVLHMGQHVASHPISLNALHMGQHVASHPIPNTLGRPAHGTACGTTPLIAARLLRPIRGKKATSHSRGDYTAQFTTRVPPPTWDRIQRSRVAASRAEVQPRSSRKPFTLTNNTCVPPTCNCRA